MQINYPNAKVRRATAPFFYAPSIQNTLQDMMVPPVYAPYGTYDFWPNTVAEAYQGSQNGVLNVPDASMAPNSGGGNNVASAAIAAGFSGTAPAANAATAAVTGQPLGPVSLVAPLPSITQSPAAPMPHPPPPCNSVDSWVSQNPMLAGLALVGAFLFVGHMR